jgi:hypothetical protein
LVLRLSKDFCNPIEVTSSGAKKNTSKKAFRGWEQVDGEVFHSKLIFGLN